MNTGFVLEILLSFGAATLLLPMAIFAAHRCGFVDKPDARRRHRLPTPTLGGVAVVFSWAAGMGWFLFRSAGSGAGLDAKLMLGGAFAMLAIGFADDRRGLPAGARILMEFIVAALVLAFMPSVQAFAVPWVADFGWGVWPLFCLWVVGVANGVNLIDGSDGLAGLVITLVAAALALAALAFGSAGGAGCCGVVCLLAPALVFLRRNWAPASVFLGDNGSLSLGFTLAISALCIVPARTSPGIFVGLLALLTYPILDTGLSSVRRRGFGLSVFSADRGHLHHRLGRLGFSASSIALLAGAISLVGFAFAAAAFSLAMNADPVSEVVGCVALSAALYALVFMGTRRLNQAEERRTRLLERAVPTALEAISGDALVVRRRVRVTVNLQPLLISALAEERGRWEEILVKVIAEIHSVAGREARVLHHEGMIRVICGGQGDLGPTHERRRFADRLRSLQQAERFQFSTCELPVMAEWETIYEAREAALASAAPNYIPLAPGMRN